MAFNKGERFRGTSEVPILPEGLEKAHRLGMALAQRGGLDRIMTSDLGRTQQTAKILSHYTHAPITYSGDGLHPWHLGAMEGQEVTPERLDLMKHLIQDAPDTPFPGLSPSSGVEGESFNSFKNRTLNFLKEAMAQHRARPDERTGLVTHGRVLTLLDSWMRKGMDPDGAIDTEHMTQPPEEPGHIKRFSIDPYVGPMMSDVDDKRGHTPLLGGLYIIRHEKTPWNSNRGTTSS
jgi:broad specificity phosphatase PhoE